MRTAHKVATAVATAGSLLLLGAPLATPATSGTTGAEQTYLVLYKQGASSDGAASRISEKPALGSLSRALISPRINW